MNNEHDRRVAVELLATLGAEVERARIAGESLTLSAGAPLALCDALSKSLSREADYAKQLKDFALAMLKGESLQAVVRHAVGAFVDVVAERAALRVEVARLRPLAPECTMPDTSGIMRDMMLASGMSEAQLDATMRQIYGPPPTGWPTRAEAEATAEARSPRWMDDANDREGK